MIAGLLLAVAPITDQLFTPMTMAERMQHTPVLIFGVLEICIGAAYLALWLAARDYRVFRTLGFFYLIVGSEQFWQYFGGDRTVWCIRCVAVAVLIEAAGEAMDIPNRRWTRLFWPLYLFTIFAGWFPSMAFVHEWPVAFSEIALILLVVQGFRGKHRRDKMIAAAFLVHFTVRMSLIPSMQHFLGIRNFVTIGGWQWQFTTITLTSLGLVTLAIFVRDLIDDRREKQRLATELEAARAIQQILIPETIPSVAGFAIESVYRPFGEVGGDFFQIIPLASGGALIAIGDVSGKGLPAAMQVSLLVGNLRALVDYTESPAAILTAVNRHMIGRSNGGFTTCLVLRADPGGLLTVANAGHLAPYLNGAELSVENGLPIGLAADCVYSESTFRLTAKDQLTLVTDGIVEARAASGELFGFERALAISRNTAESIAQAAEKFGQDDDITVLTVAYAA
jgi:hypothetical protein